MNPILNKILCFMWECQADKYFWVNIDRTNELSSIQNLVKVYYCKHCGATKHD